MKRFGNLIPLICTEDNIERSIKTVLRGNKRKNTKTAKYILSNKDKIKRKIIKDVSNGTFKLGTYRQLTINDGNKERVIQILNYYDRIVVNAIMTILDELLIKRMIYTTASSIKGRGTHYLKRIIQRDLRNNSNKVKYFYKIDINKYYHNINHTLMKVCIRRYIKDKTLLSILDNFIDMLEEGLSIGLRASQIFGNLLLSWLLDMPLKCKYRIKFYYRYCDDIVILAKTKRELWQIHSIVCNLLKNSGLTIKHNYKIAPIFIGINFLGFVIYNGIYCKVRKRIKENAKKKLTKLKSKRRRQEIIAAIKGYCLYSNSHNLFNKLITIYDTKNLRRRGYSTYTMFKSSYRQMDDTLGKVIGR